MANKPKKVFYKGKALYTNAKDFVIRVSFDKTNGTYWLYRDGKRITSRTNKDDPDKAQKDIATEFYKLVEKTNTVQIEQHHIQPKVQKHLKITWLYISESDEKLRDYLSKFHKENYDDSYWYEVSISISRKKIDKDYEPMICRFNEAQTECYILYNGVKSKEDVLKHICENLNKHNQSWNILAKDQVIGRVLENGGKILKYITVPKEKAMWTKIFNNKEINSEMEEEINKFYKNKQYYTDGESISVLQNTIDKEFIVKQFMKYLRADQHSTAILAGMPELLNISSEKINKEKVKRYTFDDILSAYKDRAEDPPSDKTKKDAENWLNEFILICSAKVNKQIKYVDEITDDQLDSYAREIYKVATQPKYKYKASWLSKKQVEYLERKNKYPKLSWQKNRIQMLKNLLTNAINELFPTPNIAESAPIERMLSHLKQAKLIDKIK